MSEERIVERHEIYCHEEKRNAKLMVEISVADGKREVVSVQCDNPRLASLKPFDCCWSCWERVQDGDAATDQGK